MYRGQKGWRLPKDKVRQAHGDGRWQVGLCRVSIEDTPSVLQSNVRDVFVANWMEHFSYSLHAIS